MSPNHGSRQTTTARLDHLSTLLTFHGVHTSGGEGKEKEYDGDDGGGNVASANKLDT